MPASTNPTPHTETRETFFARLKPILAPSEFLDVEVAYTLAKQAHRWQERKEVDVKGKPIRYFEHLRETALVLIDELGIHDPEMITTCLLHDSLEDTKDIHELMIEHLFGLSVVRMVKILSKVPKEGYYERLQKFGDSRVWVIKGCDRLANLRTLPKTPPEFQRKQIKETRTIIIPFMNHLLSETNLYGSRWKSLGDIRDKIDDVCRELEKDRP